MRLRLLHPEWEAIDCAECRKWFTDEEGQPVKLQGAGPEPERLARVGPPPCESGGECRKRSPDYEPLSERNERAYQRYLEARALGPLPAESDDALFRYHAGLVYALERRAEEFRQVKTLAAMWGVKAHA